MKTVAGSHHFVAFSGLASHRGTFPGSSYYLAVESPCAWDFLIKRQGCGAAAFHVHSPPGEREHLVQGSHFNARLRALTFHFLYWRERQCLHFTTTRLILHPNKTQLSSLLKKEAPNLHCVTVILAIEDTRDSEFNICWRRTKQESPPGVFPHLSSVLTTCSV